MKLNRLPPVVLAIALQLLPIARVVTLNQGAAPTGFAVLLRWFAGAGVLMNAFDAVSGSSAYVAGLQNLNPIGGLVTTATGAVGQSFAYRIIVANPGQNPQQAYYNVIPLPPGLTINTNLAIKGGTNAITGKPTVAGTYPVTLIAGNANFTNTVSLAVTLLIQGTGGSPPAITTQPQNVTVASGGEAGFWVAASGTAPLSYQWRKDGANISGAASATNTLTGVTTNDTGGYSVVVTNASGSVTSQVATLTVLLPVTPPGITSPPTNVTVVAGQTATFTVGATGDAPLSYQWRLNGGEVVNATNPVLTLNNARLSQAGDYTAVVTNSAGSVTSSVARLTVNLPAPPLLSLLRPQGGQFVFSFVPVVGLTNTVLRNGAFSSTGWISLTNLPPPPTATSISVTDALSGAANFYRVQVQP